jgi:hypothetical protein
MSKYNSRRVSIDGYLFDSIRESQRYSELKLMEKAGEIIHLEVHPEIELQPGFYYKDKKVKPIIYEADFYYAEQRDGILIDVYEDVKGMETPVFKLKWKMLLYQFRYSPIEFRIVR